MSVRLFFVTTLYKIHVGKGLTDTDLHCFFGDHPLWGPGDHCPERFGFEEIVADAQERLADGATVDFAPCPHWRAVQATPSLLLGKDESTPAGRQVGNLIGHPQVGDAKILTSLLTRRIVDDPIVRQDHRLHRDLVLFLSGWHDKGYSIFTVRW